MLMLLPLAALGGAAVIEGGAAGALGGTLAEAAEAAQSYGTRAVAAYAARAKEGAQYLLETFRDPVKLGTEAANQTGKWVGDLVKGAAIGSLGYAVAKVHDSMGTSPAAAARPTP